MKALSLPTQRFSIIPLKLVGSEGPTHGGQPVVGLPGRDGGVAPEHQQAITNVQVLTHHGSAMPRSYSSRSNRDSPSKPAWVTVSRQLMVFVGTGIISSHSRRERSTDITPEFVKAGDGWVATGGTGKV